VGTSETPGGKRETRRKARSRRKLLRVAFALAETRRRKLEELERAIQSFPGAEARRAEATKSRVKLSSEINSSDVAGMDGVRHVNSDINSAIATIDEILGSLRDI